MNRGRWQEDARIHRHDCGAWIYGLDPCGTCEPAPVVPIRSPTPVDNELGTVESAAHPRSTVRHDERRTA